MRFKPIVQFLPLSIFLAFILSFAPLASGATGSAATAGRPATQVASTSTSNAVTTEPSPSGTSVGQNIEPKAPAPVIAARGDANQPTLSNESEQVQIQQPLVSTPAPPTPPAVRHFACDPKDGGKINPHRIQPMYYPCRAIE